MKRAPHIGNYYLDNGYLVLLMHSNWYWVFSNSVTSDSLQKLDTRCHDDDTRSKLRGFHGNDAL